MRTEFQDLVDMAQGWCPAHQMLAQIEAGTYHSDEDWEAVPHTCHGDIVKMQAALLEANETCPCYQGSACVHENGERVCRKALLAEIEAMTEVEE